MDPNRMNIVVPDLGETPDVEVVEILVTPGDRIEADDPVLVLESDKASMDLPAPAEGVVTAVAVAVGDRVTSGTVLVSFAAGEGSPAAPQPPAESPSESVSAGDGGGGEPAAAPPGLPATPAPEPAPAIVAGDVDLRAEVVVMGAGPGGYTAAFRAADLGRHTILVERYSTLGGVCLNVGCIPSKALLGTAETMAAVEELRERGVDYAAPTLEVEKLVAWKDEVVARLTGGLASLAKRRKVEVVTGTGRFEGPHVVAVTDGDGATRRIGFDQAVIAAGSEPVTLPGFPGDDPRVIDSTGALAPTQVPRRLLVVGGGIIGLELAAVYDSLGSQVTVVELLDELLAGCDRDLVRPLERRISARYHAIRLGTRITSVEPQRRGLKVWYGDESRIYDQVLVAVGRRPSSVDAAAAGVAVDERGFIPVDACQRTNVSHIFAVGDITGPPLLAHRAAHQGKVAAEVISGLQSAFEASVIPSVVYTDPEIAWVGLTETQAKAEGRAVDRGAFPWAASGRALGMGRSEGMTKLLFDRETKRIVGAGIVGSHAGDLISEAALAIEMGADPEDLALTVHPHPTLSETLNFAAEMVAGTITDLYLPRRK